MIEKGDCVYIPSTRHEVIPKHMYCNYIYNGRQSRKFSLSSPFRCARRKKQASKVISSGVAGGQTEIATACMMARHSLPQSTMVGAPSLKYFLLSHCSLFRAPCSFTSLLQRRPFHDTRRLCKRQIIATNRGDTNQKK